MESGGEISKDIFSFPGGRRFHLLTLQETNLQYGLTTR